MSEFTASNGPGAHGPDHHRRASDLAAGKQHGRLASRASCIRIRRRVERSGPSGAGAVTVLSVAEAEAREALARDALQAADKRKDPQSISLHEYRWMKAQEALTKARHAEDLGRPCGCHLCSGRASWDD
jgi:hypothetical protein